MTYSFTGDGWKGVHSSTMIDTLKEYDTMEKIGESQQEEYNHLVKVLEKRGIVYGGKNWSESSTP